MEKKQMPQVSVIVPVYNTAAYLPRCVESILAQTFRDFELFLVDDGSTDESPRICDVYGEKDSRIRVIHQKNQGQSVARNNAIAVMEGQWVMFCDSDDWIHPRTLEWLHQTAAECGVKISIAGYEETSGEDPEVTQEQLVPEIWTPKDFYMRHFVNATIPVMKLIHREALGDLRFPVGKYIDDEYIIYRILFTQERLAVLKAPLYAYFINPVSLTKRPWNPRLLDAWQAYEEQIAFFEELGDEELVAFRYRGFLDNALISYERAMETEQTPEILRVRKFMRRRIRSLLMRMWKRGCIEFYADYETLLRSYPLRTKLYRLYLEKWKYGRWRKRWRKN